MRDPRSVLESAITAATGAPFRIAASRPVGGGSIHAALSIAGGGRRYFAKTGDAACTGQFAAEADGLAALAGAGMRVPAVVAHGAADGVAYLVLEHLELRDGDARAFRELGRALARLHADARSEHFGWHRDNFIGATPQANRWAADWASFWDRERLAPQLARAAARGFCSRLQTLGERLRAALPALLAGHAPRPSLLHGDLWRGNAGFLADGTPVVFDPAVYYGDPEADLAMTELFGGFPRAFYEGYREILPPAEGYGLRRDLYNLYHVLNHANLFGGGYAAQAERLMTRLVAAIG